MAKDSCIATRSRLVDEPIVEMLLTKKYLKSGIKFMKTEPASSGVSGMIYYANGIRQSLIVKRNSSKYFKSPNFTVTIDKNNLSVFNNVMYVFIDEVADSLYIVNGVQLLKYILTHPDKITVSNDDVKKSFVLIPKRDLILLVNDKNGIIKYNKQISKLFEIGRNEDLYRELV